MEDLMDEILADSRFTEGVAWRRREFHAGQTIIKKGDVGKTLFFIESGSVRVLGDADLEGHRKISPGLCDLSSGALFGDVCLYGPHLRTASVSAVGLVSLIEIDSEMLSVYLDDHPVKGYLFLKALFQIMTSRLVLANERIANLLAWGIKAHDIDKYL